MAVPGPEVLVTKNGARPPGGRYQVYLGNSVPRGVRPSMFRHGPGMDISLRDPLYLNPGGQLSQGLECPVSWTPRHGLGGGWCPP
jgi:hypothetical protein